MLEHPGKILKRQYCEKLEVNVLAERLGVSRCSLSRVLNGHAGISMLLAIKLEHAGFNTAKYWVIKQAMYDLEQEEEQYV